MNSNRWSFLRCSINEAFINKLDGSSILRFTDNDRKLKVLCNIKWNHQKTCILLKTCGIPQWSGNISGLGKCHFPFYPLTLNTLGKSLGPFFCLRLLYSDKIPNWAICNRKSGVEFWVKLQIFIADSKMGRKTSRHRWNHLSFEKCDVGGIFAGDNMTGNRKDFNARTIHVPE